MLKHVKSGYHHTAGITRDGVLITWGWGVFGQLGHGNTENYEIPTPIQSLIWIPMQQVSCGW